MVKKAKTIKEKGTELFALQCSGCPLLANKSETADNWKTASGDRNIDVLLITESSPSLATLNNCLEYDVVQTFLPECSAIGAKEDKEARMCCLGRKIDMIEKFKPKLVISVGYSIFKAIENHFGHNPSAINHNQLLPVSYKGHAFWHMSIADFNPRKQLMTAEKHIKEALEQEPVVS